MRGGEVVARSTPQLPAAGSDGRIAWIGALPGAGLTAGRYEVVATVKQGDLVAEERASFDLHGRTETLPRTDVPVATPPAVPPDLVPLLEAAGRYVLAYEESFQNISADETYMQSVAHAIAPRGMARVGPHRGIGDERLLRQKPACGESRRKSEKPAKQQPWPHGVFSAGIWNSTRRLRARFSWLELGRIGSLAPRPSKVTRAGSST